MDICDWLFSHEPLVLKAFDFDASIGSLGEYGRFEPSETALPVHLLSENALFQTRELSLPIFDNFPNQALQLASFPAPATDTLNTSTYQTTCEGYI